MISSSSKTGQAKGCSTPTPPALTLENVQQILCSLIKEFDKEVTDVSERSEKIWHARSIRFFGALLPVLSWPRQEEVSEINPLDLDHLMNLANSMKTSLDGMKTSLMMSSVGHLLYEFLASLPGIQRSEDGELKYSHEHTAKELFGHVSMPLSVRDYRAYFVAHVQSAATMECL